jgi:hypothetical protein
MWRICRTSLLRKNFVHIIFCLPHAELLARTTPSFVRNHLDFVFQKIYNFGDCFCGVPGPDRTLTVERLSPQAFVAHERLGRGLLVPQGLLRSPGHGRALSGAGGRDNGRTAQRKDGTTKERYNGRMGHNGRTRTRGGQGLAPGLEQPAKVTGPSRRGVPPTRCIPDRLFRFRTPR